MGSQECSMGIPCLMHLRDVIQDILVSGRLRQRFSPKISHSPRQARVAPILKVCGADSMHGVH
jgi:hypothetical protein